MPINTEEIMLNLYKWTPLTNPTATAQNKKVISFGSFIAALNLIIDSAPIKPRERARLPLIAIIITVTTKDVKTRVTLKLLEYKTPE